MKVLQEKIPNQGAPTLILIREELQVFSKKHSAN